MCTSMNLLLLINIQRLCLRSPLTWLWAGLVFREEGRSDVVTYFKLVSRKKGMLDLDIHEDQ